MSEFELKMSVTPLPWMVGQLPAGMAHRGCENLYALFSKSHAQTNTQMTVAENMTRADAILIARAVNSNAALVAALRDTVQHIEQIARRNVSAQESDPVSQGAYRAAIEVFNRMSVARELLSLFDEDAPFTASEADFSRLRSQLGV